MQTKMGSQSTVQQKGESVSGGRFKLGRGYSLVSAVTDGDAVVALVVVTHMFPSETKPKGYTKYILNFAHLMKYFSSSQYIYIYFFLFQKSNF